MRNSGLLKGGTRSKDLSAEGLAAAKYVKEQVDALRYGVDIQHYIPEKTKPLLRTEDGKQLSAGVIDGNHWHTNREFLLKGPPPKDADVAFGEKGKAFAGLLKDAEKRNTRVVSPIAFSARISDDDADEIVVHFDDEVTINGRYYDLARSLFGKSLNFKRDPKSTKSPLSVLKGDELVGLIALYRLEEMPPGVIALHEASKGSARETDAPVPEKAKKSQRRPAKPDTTTSDQPPKVDAPKPSVSNQVKTIVRRSMPLEDVKDEFEQSANIEGETSETIEEMLVEQFAGSIKSELTEKEIAFDETALLGEVRATIRRMMPARESPTTTSSRLTQDAASKEEAKVTTSPAQKTAPTIPSTREGENAKGREIREKFNAAGDAFTAELRAESGTLHSGINPKLLGLAANVVATGTAYYVYHGTRRVKQIAEMLINEYGVDVFKQYMRRSFRIAYNQVRRRFESENEPWVGEMTPKGEIQSELEEAISEAEAKGSESPQQPAATVPEKTPEPELPKIRERATPARLSGQGRSAVWGVQLPTDVQAQEGDIAHVTTRRGKSWYVELARKMTTRTAYRGSGQVDIFDTGRRFQTEEEANNAIRAIRDERRRKGQPVSALDTPVAGGMDTGEAGAGSVPPGETLPQEGTSAPVRTGVSDVSQSMGTGDDLRGSGGRGGEDVSGDAATEGDPGATEGTGSIRPADDTSALTAAGDNEGQGNFGISPDDFAELTEGSIRDRVNRNLDIIETLNQLDDQQRAPTPEERKLIASYTGWGIAKPVLHQDKSKIRDKWAQQARERMESLLGPEAVADIARSILNAHYTSPETVHAIWQGITEDIGGQVVQALEPSAGSGLFLGIGPNVTQWTANDLDATSARILGALYPDAAVSRQGFEDMAVPNDFYNLAISNVPFANIKPFDPLHRNLRGMVLHDFFIAKMLHAVRPGGLVVAITSKGTMDKLDSYARQGIEKLGDFLGAVRLPFDHFKDNAGAEVTTDVIVIKRRKADVSSSGESWEQSKTMDIDGEELNVNEYYHKNPNRIAGRLVSRKGRYGSAKEMAVESTEVDPNEAIRELFRDLAKEGQIDKNLGQPQSSSQNQSPRERLFEELENALDTASKVPFSNVPGVSELYFEVEKLSDLDSQVRDLSSASEADTLREQVHEKYSDTVSKLGMSLHAMIHERRIERDSRATKQILSLETHLDVEQNRRSSVKERRYIASGVLTRSREAEILRRQAAIESTKTIQEAVNVSRNERGSIDVSLVAKSLRVDPEEARQQMLDSGLAFAVPVDYEDPEVGGETLVGREEFLSGNLGQKIDLLEEMMEREEFDDPEIKERYVQAWIR